MIDVIRKSLQASLDHKVVDELLKEYADTKRRYYAGDLGPSAVAGGRFSEAAFRLLQEAILGTGNFTALGKKLPSIDSLMSQLAQDRGNSTLHSQQWQRDSIGLHIPRALRIIYDIRNNRDAAHLADGIDPNQQDATLVISVMDWVMAEFVRLYHKVSADAAQRIVRDLIVRAVPAIQEFGGTPRVLRTGLQMEQIVITLLYQRGARGAHWHELHAWIPQAKQSYLQATLRTLDERNHIHFYHDTGNYEITAAGIKYVQQNKLDQPL